MVQALPTPLRPHRRICSTPTAQAPTQANTKDIVVDRAFLALTNLLLLPTTFMAAAFLMDPSLDIIANRVMSVARCHLALVVTKKMKAWQLPSSFFPVVLVVMEHLGLSQSLSQQMLLQCLIFLRSI
jgi:hypothetical protein